MEYYKLIKDDEIIGVISNYDFRSVQKKHNLIVYCEPNDVEFVEYKNGFYRATWMAPTETIEPFFTLADIVNIDEEEYNALVEAFETEETIAIEEPVVEQEEETAEEPNVTIEFLQSAKIDQMSAACKATIREGFDIELSDGEEHHFSLDTEDQLNLITLSQMIAAGSDAIPYHADGELCKYFSNADATLIMNEATDFKTYHVTYFNSLKQYIRTLETPIDIYSVSYGIDIPVEYQSEILKDLLAFGEEE